jgi:hypothetical protein
MIDLEEMLELCRTEAPESKATPQFEFSYPPITFTGTYIPTNYIPVEYVMPVQMIETGGMNGMVLHCCSCFYPLTFVDGNCWCEHCKIAPSSKDMFLARPKVRSTTESQVCPWCGKKNGAKPPNDCHCGAR